MKKRMLFLDLDGTLLDDDKQITEGNRAALDGALERGHDVVITTGDGKGNFVKYIFTE